ncbi:MAG TPA: DNA translocase FtsK, partial [Desulfobacteraceae bacterium]|nr:DNA translocase FtsK [Desulfobacteraceae bacterium]
VFYIKTGPLGGANNLFGTVGAHLSGWIFHVFGFSSWWMVVVFLAMAVLSFQGKRLLSPVLNGLAILCLTLSFAGLLGLYLPDPILYRGEKEVMAGGLLGYHLSGYMKRFLNDFGAYVLLSAAFVLALMITTRISFGWIFSGIFRWCLIVFRAAREHVVRLMERKRKRRVREEGLRKAKKTPKTRVTIVEPKKEPPRAPAQASFTFMERSGTFKLPPIELLDKPPLDPGVDIRRESLEMNARRVERKLADFGVEGEVVEILPGPVVTMYEFKPAPGIKISKVAGLSDDLALVLRAPSVRIVAPIPGKAAIGIEIANNQRAPVYLSEVLSGQAFQDAKQGLPIALGKDITGSPFVTDLSRMPHLLVAGATGTGKSVSLNAMINSLLFKVTPDMVRFVMIDPKRIELSVYQNIPHLLHPVVTQPKEATRALKWAVEEMERRYMLLSDRGVRNIEAYNRRIVKEKKPATQDPSRGVDKNLPYIVVVIDELADLMMTSSRDVEEAITRL